jgi:uncharacterized membrane protein YphA (DoxX/SURF4 family)
MKWETIRRGWDEFFFKPQSPLPFAVYRILYGVLILVCLCVMIGPDREFWYGQNGIMDQAIIVKNYWRQPIFDLFNITGDGIVGLNIVFYTALVSAFFVMIGFGTRYSAWLLFMCMVSFHYHDPWNLNSGDAFLRLSALFLGFSQAGEALSVDKWLKKKYHPEQVKEAYWPWAQRLFQIQVAIVYWQTSVSKLSGDQWINGSAVWYATRLEDMIHFHVPFIFDSVFLCHLFSWGTLVIETALWTLIWVKELRYWVLLAGLALHVGIDIFISLPLFEWAFICSYVTFIEPADLEAFFARVRAFCVRCMGREQKILQPSTGTEPG